MIIKEKILLEFNTQTISGLIYPDELLPKIMLSIIHNNIGGILQEDTNPVIPEDKEPVFKLINPQCVVDNDNEKQLMLICDVDINENKLTKEEIEAINTKPWRLSIIGTGSVDEETLKVKDDYEIKYTNIEFISEKLYNGKNN